jgi:leucyl-tRNA synthetase
MHIDLVLRWIRVQALLIMPIAPHFAEHVWRSFLGETSSVQMARWPEPSAPVDNSVTEALSYVSGTVKTVRDAEILLTKKAKSKNAATSAVRYNERAPKECHMFVAKHFPEWQDKCVSVVQRHYNESTDPFDDKAIRDELAKEGMLKDKKVMNFIVIFKRRIVDFGPSTAFDRLLPFNEIETLKAASGYLKKSMNFQQIHVHAIEDKDSYKGVDVDPKILENAEPGQPSFIFFNIDVPSATKVSNT